MTAGALTRAPVSPLSFTRGAFIALGASIPISTAVDTVLVGVIVLTWLAAARFRETASAMRNNPVALTACIWFAAHVAGAVYSSGTPDEIWRSISKAAVFLLVPIGVVAMRDVRDIRLAHYAFMSAVALTALLSYARWAGLFPGAWYVLKDTGYSRSVVFKYHLTQNLMLAYGSFVFAVYACRAQTRRARVLLGAGAALAALSVLLIGDGRTGQIVLFVLALYFGAWCGGKRGTAAALVVAFAVGAGAYVLPGSSLQKRVDLARSDVAEWQPGVPGKPSGVTERLEFYKRGVQIFSEHPVFGVGSGGFAAADRELASARGMPAAKHPHSEYLFNAVELGVFGVVLMIALFWVPWREARHLPERTDMAIARGLVIMFAAGSFGTAMLRDHAETLLFVWMAAVLFSSWRPRPGSQP